MQYNGGKSRIARKIVDMLPLSQNGVVYEPFCGGGSVTEKLAAKYRHVFASDAFPPTIQVYHAVLAGLRLAPIDEEAYKGMRHGDATAKRACYGFGVSFGGKWFGGVARPQERYCSYFNSWADRMRALKNVTYFCAPYHLVPIVPGTVIYCDPPYQGTTGYATGKFDSEAFFGWARRAAAMGCRVFISEEKTPFRLVCEIPRGGNGVGNCSNRPDRLWEVA